MDQLFFNFRNPSSGSVLQATDEVSQLLQHGATHEPGTTGLCSAVEISLFNSRVCKTSMWVCLKMGYIPNEIAI